MVLGSEAAAGPSLAAGAAAGAAGAAEAAATGAAGSAASADSSTVSSCLVAPVGRPPLIQEPSPHFSEYTQAMHDDLNALGAASCRACNRMCG